jgi:hypothetical protein
MFDRVEYWLKDQSTQNFGDSLSRVLMDRLFLPAGFGSGVVHVIGSVVDDSYVRVAQEVRPDTVPVFWTCGIRTPNGLSESNRRRVKILAVRGPVSAAGLGVEGQVPTGDSALILPAIYQPARAPSYEGRSICIPHFCDTRSDSELLAISNCDAVVRPNIGPDLADVYRLVDTIAAADFVLSASLHGAIVAAAYHRPFCFWDAGLPPDVPLKWEDFAASVNFEPVFAANVADARAIYQKSIGPRIRLPALAPLVECAPFAVRSDAYRKVQAYDAANLSEKSASPQMEPVNLAHELIGHLAVRLNYGAGANPKERTSQKVPSSDLAEADTHLPKRATELHEQMLSLLNDRNRLQRRFFQKVKFCWRAERYRRIIQRSGLFDEAWYRKTYADVGDKPIDALRHYVNVGRFEGKNPNPYFDTNWYLWNYPHVLITGADPLAHYIRKGVREGLNPGPDFDTSAYLRKFPELSNGSINPLYHFLTHTPGGDPQEAAATQTPVTPHGDIQNPRPTIVLVDETYPPPPDERSATSDTAHLIAQILESGFRVVFIAHAQFRDPSKQRDWLEIAGVEVIDGSRYASIDAYILEEGARADLILLSRIHVGGRSRPRVSARRS